MPKLQGDAPLRVLFFRPEMGPSNRQISMMSQEDRKTRGTIFNIQKYSVDDGPGIRTIVFFKGCLLSCRWCGNPESQSFQMELAFNEGRCLGLSKCKRCLNACPNHAIGRVDDKPVFNRAACSACEKPCVAACPASGIIAYGERKSVEDVLKVVEQDGLFYGRSGGGITLSGGEPLAQPAFALALLREARHRRLNTAVESCGHVPWEVLHDAAMNLNTIMFDIKSLDSERHKEFTGVSTNLITANFRRLVDEFPDLPIHVRTPVVPGFNDTPEDVVAIAEFVSGCRNVSYELLPYHRLGTQKYAFLNRDMPMGGVSLPAETFQMLKEITLEVFGPPAELTQ
jgi:pyruvate formate lyase activating enzyme